MKRFLPSVNRIDSVLCTSLPPSAFNFTNHLSPIQTFTPANSLYFKGWQAYHASVPCDSSSLEMLPDQIPPEIPRRDALIARMQVEARRVIQLRQQMAQDRTRLLRLGSIQTNLKSSQPSSLGTHPPAISDVTLATLISATLHLGHHKSNTCPTNYPLIYGTRSDISVIDLRQTLSYLRRACNVIKETVERDGIILFGHGVQGSEKAIKSASQKLETNGYWLGQKSNARGTRWVRGTLTNAPQVLRRPRQVAKQLRFASESSNDTHQPSNQRRQQAENLEALKFMPSLIVVFNPKESKVLLREAALKQIPTIGIIDTDVDPRVVTYPIPANDDSIRSVELIAGILGRAGQEGLKRRSEGFNLMLAGSGAKGP